MLKFSNLAALAILSAVAANACAEEKSVAIVNGVSIPQSRAEMRVKAAAAQGQPDGAELRKAIREDLINLELISQEAAKKGLDKEPETAQQIVLSRQSVLANAFVQDYVKTHPVSEDVLKQEYESFKTRVGNKELKLSHILVEKEDDAKAIVAQLKKGAKFAKLAKDKSKDPGSANKGGDLDWAVPSTFVQPFAEAALKLNKGQVSDPVQTQFGWHVIKLEDVREPKIPPFDQIKSEIQRSLMQKALQKFIADLRSNAKVE